LQDRFGKVLLQVTLAAGLIYAAPGQTRQVTDAEVERVHRSALLLDTHNDITSMTVDGFDIGSTGGRTETDIERLVKGGVGATFFAAYVAGSYVEGNRSARRCLEMIDTIRHDIVGRYPGTFELALTASDILAARQRGRIAALIGIEGGHAIEDSLRLLRNYYSVGVRYMTLTHSNTNNWADSSGDANDPQVKRHGGLTAFGREVVREMNRLGMIVDVSHVADETFWHALETSRAPLFASHSSCRALTSVPRNMTDEMIAAMAAKGGVIQINFACGFVSQAHADARAQQEAALARRIAAARERLRTDPAALKRELEAIRSERGKGLPRAAVADVVAHIDHAVKVGGIGAVGIGSDFDGISCAPEGLSQVSEFPNLTRALLERGYSADDIRRIYGENTLRVMREVERAAAQMRDKP
jgi:membrane dipeptidase